MPSACASRPRGTWIVTAGTWPTTKPDGDVINGGGWPVSIEPTEWRKPSYKRGPSMKRVIRWRISGWLALGCTLACAPVADAQDASVKLTTKLGVETSFVAKYPFSSAPRPVERLLQQYNKDD